MSEFVSPETAARALEALAFAKSLGLDKAGAEFLKTILAEPGKDLSEILAHYTTRRFKNFLKIGQRSQQLIEDAKLTAREVPLRLMEPIMQGAGNEEEPEMQELWAALLANAATAGGDLAPLYPRILSSLSPSTARVMSRIHRTIELVEQRHIPREVGRPSASLTLYEIINPHPEFGDGFERLDETVATLAISELMALGVVETASLEARRWIDQRVGQPVEYQLSAAGSAFMRACQPPRAESSGVKSS